MNLKNNLFIILLVVIASCKDKNHVNYSAIHFAQPPVIDGTMDSMWLNAKPALINGDIIGDLYMKDSTDLTASFRCAWDNNNLYFFISVIDDIRFGDVSGLLQPYDNDDIEFYFKTPSIQKDKKKQLQVFSFISKCDSVLSKIHLDYKLVSDANGYKLEISIPLKALNIKNTSDLIDFNIEINDNDNPYPPNSGMMMERETSISWMPNSARLSWSGNIKFGKIKLQN
ncbi:MAG: hypothetical protein HOO91_18840 [Bacteroidales bacterium]|nr:hypothetical protein [Bacteroidales bacterium]